MYMYSWRGAARGENCVLTGVGREESRLFDGVAVRVVAWLECRQMYQRLQVMATGVMVTVIGLCQSTTCIGGCSEHGRAAHRMASRTREQAAGAAERDQRMQLTYRRGVASLEQDT